MSATTPVLSVSGLRVEFGGLVALDDVSFEFDRTRVHGVIGPNGAGKTTLLNVLSGLQKPSSGSVSVNGVDITRWSAQRIVNRARMARTFQTVRLFASMTVRENIAIAARCSGARRDVPALVDELLQRMRLAGVADELATSLSYGYQRSVELARALASRPQVILLDEPAAGVSAPERQQLADVLRSLGRDGVCVVLVEHHMDLVHAVCEDCAVLDFGSVISAGSTAEVMADPKVLEAYLGRPRGSVDQLDAPVGGDA